MLSSREETPSSHTPAEEEVHSYSLPLLALQTRTGLFQLRTARQLPVHPSSAQLTELSAGWGQQWRSQSSTAAPSRAVLWEGRNRSCPLALPLQRTSSTGRQELPGAETEPTQEQVHEDKKKIDWSLIPSFLFPLSSAVPYLAHALGSPGVSELFITAGKQTLLALTQLHWASRYRNSLPRKPRCTGG